MNSEPAAYSMQTFFGEVRYQDIARMFPIGALDRPKNDWTLECNMVAWNGGDPKIDIRSWSPDHRKMTRGITLTEEQGEKLVKSLGQRMLDKQKARTERDPYER